MNEDERRRMTRREIRRRKRRNSIILKSVVVGLLLVVLIVAIWYVTRGTTSRKSNNESAGFIPNTSAGTNPGGNQIVPGTTETSAGNTGEAQGQTETQQPGTTGGESAAAPVTDRDLAISQASMLATQYDYDAAIEMLKSIPGAEEDAQIVSMLADYETARSNLVAVSPYDITHIFFHSLVVDPARGFALYGDAGWDNATIGFCEWMTTVYEFNQIMQQMYDRGYVLVSLYDMVEETTDENGYVHITPKNIYLPQGKTPFVLSLDDLSYYHSYNNRGTASKMIVNEEGKPVCEYYDAEGNLHVGAYDCVPLLDEFVEAHPDFSYKGAKGTIALTGYNGILGYRTDYCYRDRVELTADQELWLEEHPDFNWEQECAEAAKVAQAIKDDGWTFASHTWGHIHIGDVDMERLQTDTGKWLEFVAPLIGGSDIIIFAHGQDLAAWNEDYASAEKFLYLKDQGFNIYCNVDSSQYFVQLGDEFLRMGRRNLDGYRIWRAVYADDDRISDLVDAASVIDPARPTDASLYEL